MPSTAKPEAIDAEGPPAIPAELAAGVGPYLEARFALVEGWRARDRSRASAEETRKPTRRFRPAQSPEAQRPGRRTSAQHEPRDD